MKYPYILIENIKTGEYFRFPKGLEIPEGFKKKNKYKPHKNLDRELNVYDEDDELKPIFWAIKRFELNNQILREKIIITTFDEYQRRTSDTATPESQSAAYLFDGLISEAGEVIGKYAKRVRADYTETQFRQEVKSELGDVCWFVAQIAKLKNLHLSVIVHTEKINDFLVAPLLTDNLNFMHPRYEILRHSLTLAEIEFSDVAPTPGDYEFSISHGLKLILANVLRIAEENQLTLQSIMNANIEKLAERKKNGKIKGDGDNR